MIKFKVKKTVDNIDILKDAATSFSKTHINVGITKDNPKAVQVGYDLEYGNPLTNVPPQSFLVSGVNNEMDNNIIIMRKAIRGCFKHYEHMDTLITNSLLEIGENTKHSVKKEIDRKILDDSTIQPLLMNAITYEIKSDDI